MICGYDTNPNEVNVDKGNIVMMGSGDGSLGSNKLIQLPYFMAEETSAQRGLDRLRSHSLGVSAEVSQAHDPQLTLFLPLTSFLHPAISKCLGT